jgi:hypothetical protein
MAGLDRSPAPSRRRASPPAAALLAEFVDEMTGSHLPETQDLRDLTVDKSVDRFLDEYLAVEKGRAEKTINDYRYLHERWFSPTIGAQQVKRIESATMDRLFGAMRQASLSASWA